MRPTARPRTFRRPLNAGGIIVAAALLLTACGGADDPSDASGPEPWGPLAVMPAGEAGDGALIEGVLEVTGECVLLDERGNDVLLVWPADRVGWDAEAETVTFESTSGEVVTLSHGDRIAFGGGGSSQQEGGQSNEEFIEGLEWVSRPNAACVADTRWFVYDIVR